MILHTSLTVMIVEDEDVIRALIITMLQGLNGFRLIPTHCADLALSLLKGSDVLNMLIVDMGLAGSECTGEELIKYCKIIHPEAKILAISGGFGSYSEEQALSIARKVGSDGTLAKPFSRMELLLKLKKLLGLV